MAATTLVSPLLGSARLGAAQTRPKLYQTRPLSFFEINGLAFQR